MIPGSSSTNSTCGFILYAYGFGLPRHRRQFQRKPCSAARGTFNSHSAGMCFHNSFDEAEAQSGTVDLIIHRFLPPEERFKDMTQFVGLDPRTAVLYGNEDPLVSRGNRSPDADPVATILGSVGDQVLHAVRQGGGVSRNIR